MNNSIPKAVGIVLFSLFSQGIYADWNQDCNDIQSLGPLPGACSTIMRVKGDLENFMPPPPCVNGESLATFTPGDRATCNGSSGGGGSGGGSQPPPQISEPSSTWR